MSVVIEKILSDHIEEDWSTETSEDQEVRLAALVGDLTTRSARLVPAEAEATREVAQRLRIAQRDLARAGLASKYSTAKVLSLEPLTWTNSISRRRHNIAVPKLALLPLHESKVAIKSPQYWNGNFHVQWRGEHTAYPGIINAIYHPISEGLQKAQRSHEKLWLEWEFKHAIPDSVKMLIADVAPTRDFECIYLLCDAPVEEWKLESIQEPKPPVLVDPLLVGWACESLWLLDAFDPTPLEEYIASEFAVRPQLTAGS